MRRKVETRCRLYYKCLEAHRSIVPRCIEIWPIISIHSSSYAFNDSATIRFHSWNALNTIQFLCASPCYYSHKILFHPSPKCKFYHFTLDSNFHYLPTRNDQFWQSIYPMNYETTSEIRISIVAEFRYEDLLWHSTNNPKWCVSENCSRNPQKTA